MGAGGLGVGVEVDRAALPGGHDLLHLVLVGRVHILSGVAQRIAGEAAVRVHGIKDIGAGGVVVGEASHIDEVAVGGDYQGVQPVLDLQIGRIDLSGLQIVLQPVRIQVAFGGLRDLIGGAVVLILQHSSKLSVAHVADGGAQQHAQQQHAGDELYGESGDLLFHASPIFSDPSAAAAKKRRLSASRRICTGLYWAMVRPQLAKASS